MAGILSHTLKDIYQPRRPVTASPETWAAAGFDDTLLRWKMKPEVVHGEKKDIQPRVQARGGQVGHRA
ncbi:hypothetical protein, partial [Acidovorax sp.]|uniref:hypothetical protein n=1 Tax=Acidovorax sp. TaxID=1872122 RepID=UPI0031CE8C15